MSHILLLLPRGRLCRGALEGTWGVKGNKVTKEREEEQGQKRTAWFSVPHPGLGYQ